MEEVFLRFRHLGEQIFELLDTGSLNKCTEVDKCWNEFVNTWKLPWTRMIQSYVKTTRPWREFFRKANIEKLKVIVKAIIEANPDDDEYFPHNGTPLIFAAMSGNVEIVACFALLALSNITERFYLGNNLHNVRGIFFIVKLLLEIN